MGGGRLGAHVVLGEAELDDAGGVGGGVIGVVGAAAEAGVVEGVLVPGAHDGAAGGEGRERARGEEAPREGAVDRSILKKNEHTQVAKLQ